MQKQLIKIISLALVIIVCMIIPTSVKTFTPVEEPHVETQIVKPPIKIEKPEPEPVYELVDIPTADTPSIDSFVTIYDVEAAIANVDEIITEYDELLLTIPSEHPQFDDILQAKSSLLDVIGDYRNVLIEHWKTREKDRPIMTHIWIALKNFGWSDEVVAGIIGNLIAEAGGMGYQDIEWDIYARDENGNRYYGICMWALRYAPELENCISLDVQLDYLYSTIEREIDHVYSKPYRNKYGLVDLRYDDFVLIDNPYDAAIAFAVCYERCGSTYVDRRGALADKAYDYYINLNSWPWP